MDTPTCAVRNSSIELLRLLLMFLIVLGHCIIHGLGLYGLSPNSHGIINLISNSDLPIVMVIYGFCTCAVDCFVLISGYYKIKLTKKKFLSILFSLLFYVILLNLTPNLIQHNYSMAIRDILFISHSPYWFIIDYLFLMIFAPLLNFLFERMSSRYYKILLITMLLASCYLGFLYNNPINTNGYTLFQFILMYCIGRYIKLHNIKIPNSIAIPSYILGAILCGLLMYAMYHFNLNNYIWRMAYYNNPIVMLNSLMLFYIFLNINIKSQLINSIAASTLAIYLVQSSNWVSTIMYNQIAVWAKTTPPIYIWLYINILTIGTIAISLLIDKLRTYLGSKVLK